MVKYMNKALDDIVNCIKNSSEYLDCIEIKEKMNKNIEITSRVEKIKNLQKKYVRTQDSNFLDEIETIEKELNEIPLYVIYNQKLEVVNSKINYVCDETNNYFNNLLNN